jgi:uncharacterized membrane protein
LYRKWRQPEVFEKIFDHFARITVTSDQSSHWVIKAPFGKVFEWDSWITDEQPGESISWQSSDDSQLPNRGQLIFRQAPGNKGTEMIMELCFSPKGGPIRKKLADVFQVIPRSIATKALRRFKSYVETGEIPTAEFQIETEEYGGEYESAMLERR